MYKSRQNYSFPGTSYAPVAALEPKYSFPSSSPSSSVNRTYTPSFSISSGRIHPGPPVSFPNSTSTVRMHLPGGDAIECRERVRHSQRSLHCDPVRAIPDSTLAALVAERALVSERALAAETAARALATQRALAAAACPYDSSKILKQGILGIVEGGVAGLAKPTPANILRTCFLGAASGVAVGAVEAKMEQASCRKNIFKTGSF